MCSFFTTIEDEAALFGVKLKSTFSNIAKQIHAVFTNKSTIQFSNLFTQNIENDKAAIGNYIEAVNSGKSAEEAFSMTMREASVEAQNFANSLNVVKVAKEGLGTKIKTTTDQYAYNQKMVELSSIAQNKSLENVKAILNEYNSEMAKTGLEQKDFIKSVSQSNPVLGKYLSNVETGKAKMSGYVGSLIAGKAATIGLQLATTALNAVISMGIGWAISSFIGMVSEAINSANELRDSIIDTAKESSDHIKELESSMKSYLELDTTATEADKASALKSVTEQINNKTEALKNATEAEKGYAEAVKESIKTDYSDAAGKAKDAAVAAKEKIAGQWSTDFTRQIQVGDSNNDVAYSEIKDILGKYISLDDYNIPGSKTKAYYLGDTYSQNNINTNDIESLLTYYDKLQQAQEAIQQKALELGDSGNALLESPLYKALSEILSNETNKTNIDDYITNRSEEIYNSAIASQGIPETVEQFNTLKDTMLQQAGDSSLLADSITNRLNSAFGSLADEAVKAEHSVSTLDFTITDEELEGQIEGLQDSLSKIADNYKKISGVIDDYNKNGSLSIDNLETLISVGDEYISTLFDENGRLNLNKESYAKLAKAKLEDIRYSMLENAISSLNQLSKDDETSANNELSESTGNLTEETLKLVAAKKLAEGVDSSQIQKIINTYYQWSAIIDNTEAGLENNIDATLGLESASDKLKDSLESEKKALENSKSALEDKKKALESQKEALESYKDALEGAQDDIQSLIDLTIDYIKQMKENEKDAINEQIDALEKQKDALDDQKDTYSDLISKKKEEIELLYEEKKAQDELSEKQKSAAKDALSLAIAQLDDSSAGKKSQKQAADNYAESSKDLKDYLDEQEKDKRISALEEEETAYSEMIEKRKAAIDEQVEHLESKIDEIDAYLDNSRKLYEDACNMIDNDNGTLYSNLWNYTYTYTTKTRAEFDYLWSSAQAAIQRYKGDNDTLISTMEILQGKIYDTDRQIGYLDDAISSTSDAISATSDSIDSVSGSLDGLGNSISDYINKLNKLTGINVGGIDNSDTTPKYLGHGYDAASGNYYYKVKFRGRDYYGYVGDSSDTTAVRERAYNAIMKEVYKYNSFNDINPLLFKNAIVNHHAKGTRHSAGGVSVTQEEGLEAIFGKLSQGQYTMMPQGSQVFNAGMTDNLWKFSSDPQKFTSDVIGKMSSFLSSSYGNFADSARGVTNKVTKYGGNMTFSSAPVYHIYGKVDNDTLNKMDKQEKQRYELFKKQFMLEMLREKNNL